LFMLLIKIGIILIMLLGLSLTLAPRFAGTVIILFGAVLYEFITGFSTMIIWVWVLLLGLTVLAEGGGRMLRNYLTRRSQAARSFSASATVGHIGGVLAANALLGPFWGVILWELIIGKTMVPRWDFIYAVIIRMAAAATLRFMSGVVMIVLVIGWLM